MLTAAALAAAPVGMQKQMIGERIHRKLTDYDSEKAAKITGMMLEMDNNDLLELLGNQEALSAKAAEADNVLTGTAIVATSRPRKRWVPVATQSS